MRGDSSLNRRRPRWSGSHRRSWIVRADPIRTSARMRRSHFDPVPKVGLDSLPDFEGRGELGPHPSWNGLDSGPLGAAIDSHPFCIT